MSWPLLLALAIGPALALLHVIWSFDRHKEPLANVLRYLFVGALTVIPAVIVEGSLRGSYRGIVDEEQKPGLVTLLFGIVIGVALVEESCKRFGLMKVARNDREIDEPFDWIVYAVTIALGFALVENIAYVLVAGIGAGVARSVTAVPCHALCGTMMGHRLALASRLQGKSAKPQRILSLVEPTIWHGLYDFFVIGAVMESTDKKLGSAGLLVAGFCVLVLCQWIVCVRRIRRVRMMESAIPPILYPIEALRRVARITGTR